MKVLIVAPSKPTLTVGTLKDLLEGLPDDTQITVGLHNIEDTTCEYANIRTVDIPDFDESFFLNLNLEDTFDSQQL